MFVGFLHSGRPACLLACMAKLAQQNAANSGVGRAAIALTKARGLRSINLMRASGQVLALQAAGADIVLVDQPGAAA